MRLSLIIPTVERPEALRRLLTSLTLQTELADEIIIVDQGDSAASVVEAFSTLRINHLRLTERSLTKARNVGIAATTGDVVGFLDDDCVLESTYVARIKAFFSTHPSALGVQGLITNFAEGHKQKVGGHEWQYGLYQFFARVFLLNHGNTTNQLLLSGRNQYASDITVVAPCEWLSGVGNYRRSVFSEFQFDEHLKGYAFGEDKLFSYPIQEKHPKTLFVDPSIRLTHEHDPIGRPMGREWVEMKITYTHYLWQKLLARKGLPALLAFWWANVGDMCTAFGAVLLGQQPVAFWQWHVQSYWRLVWQKK